MMGLIALLQTTQNRYRSRLIRFVHHYLLESSLQCLIGLEIFLILIQCRCTDSAQITTSQRRLQYIRCVHGSATLSGSYQRVDLIDKQDDLTRCGYDFVYYAFQTLLKLALVFRTRNERTHIEGVDLFLLQVLGDVTTHDTMGKTFCNSRLTYTRFTDQNRVILRSTTQNL